jgi:protein-disulfide isomerase
VVVGLAASLASLIDDLGPAPAFCAESGCETVRTSAWARPLGVPMSLLGVGYFGVMLALAFVDRPRLRAALAIAGGAWGAGLLAVQALAIGAWCTLCVVADSAAIVLAVSMAGGATTLAWRWPRLALAAAGVATGVGGLALATHPPAPASGDASAIAVAQAEDRVTIVELIDFECPFCRQMQLRLDRAIAVAGVPVTIDRRMVPLPGHAGALPAALAWCCADEQGKGEEMARALFEADPAELTAEGCERIAARIGCDLARYRAAMGRAEQRVAGDLEAARAAGVRGLPTLVIGDARFVGASASTDELVRAIHRAAR